MYSSLVRSIFDQHLHLLALPLSLPAVPLVARKHLLTLCRVQSPHYADPSSTCYQRLFRALDIMVPNLKTSGQLVSLLELMAPYPFESPVFAGLLSALIRSAPILPHDAIDALDESWGKEILAATSSTHPRCFHWEALLDHDHVTRHLARFHPDLPHNPSVHHDIYNRLSKGLSILSLRPLYPQISDKSLGTTSRRLMTHTTLTGPDCKTGEEAKGIIDQYFSEVQYPYDDYCSTKGLEWLYSRLGVQLCGVTELRTAWKFNDLKPRTYYARGPDQYYASRYIQTVFNVLIDTLPMANRFTRFDVSSFRVPPGYMAFIYDYSSFTSKLDEIRCFLLELETFCRGTMVTVIDTYNGPRRVDLGDLIRDFREECNTFPDFDIRRYDDGGQPGEPNIRTHTAGMLGVPGNITSSTLLHSLHLAIVLGSLHHGKCVGDDAIGFMETKSESQLEADIQGIGDASMEKGKIWWEGDDEADADTSWHYVKRPIDLVEGRFHQGWLLTFPTITGFFNIDDGIHVHRYQNAYVQGKRQANQLLRLCRAAEERENQLSEDEINILDRFVRVMSGAAINSRHSDTRHLLIPRSFEPDWQANTIFQRWDDLLQIPVGTTDKHHQKMGTDDDHWKREETFQARLSPPIRLARQLQWAIVEPLFRNVSPADDFGLVMDFISGRIVPEYSVTLLRSCPQFIVELVNGVSAEELTVEKIVDLYELPFNQVEEDEDW